MTDPDMPIHVAVMNFPERTQTSRKTTLKTWTLDPAGAAGPTFAAICDYEPNRLRMEIQTLDFQIAITTDAPNQAAGTVSTTGAAPVQGRVLSTGQLYNYYGQDAFWIYNLNTITRVTVLKEYE